jgi:hypothetical protein
MSRSLRELLAVQDPAWEMVAGWIGGAQVPVEVLAVDEQLRGEALFESQVTVHSPMGAVIYNTGGILIDSGWLRVLGSGHPKFRRTLPSWNRDCAAAFEGKPAKFLLIADDVVGGFFAVNGGAFPGALGGVSYFAPDALRWEALGGMTYSQFLAWSVSSAIKEFYQNMYWGGWELEIATLSGDEALSIYPPLWTAEGKNIVACSRRSCPISEIFSLNVNELPKQLAARLE